MVSVLGAIFGSEAKTLYWRPNKGAFATDDVGLHLLLSQLSGHAWHQWSESYFEVADNPNPRFNEHCSLCGWEVGHLVHSEFEEHGRRHRAQLGKEFTEALMTMIAVGEGVLTVEQVRDVLGYDKSLCSSKYPYWRRSAR